MSDEPFEVFAETVTLMSATTTILEVGKIIIRETMPVVFAVKMMARDFYLAQVRMGFIQHDHRVSQHQQD